MSLNELNGKSIADENNGNGKTNHPALLKESVIKAGVLISTVLKEISQLFEDEQPNAQKVGTNIVQAVTTLQSGFSEEPPINSFGAKNSKERPSLHEQLASDNFKGIIAIDHRISISDIAS